MYEQTQPTYLEDILFGKKNRFDPSKKELSPYVDPDSKKAKKKDTKKKSKPLVSEEEAIDEMVKDVTKSIKKQKKMINETLQRFEEDDEETIIVIGE